ncbi:DUF1127 domain-containing protein [Jannaschia marina]|uniref:DUF1127 domain-containing protein n=1 Tax=Jannaschia marina TaxID=2741674 RepID=UPI0015C7BA07|nr:DUF1127 domain-containing protein [Jannaschia marina]
MATFDAFTPARPAPSMGAFSNLLGRVIAWNDRRVTVKMLKGLTDRELADIGLERGEIHSWANR